MIETCIECDKPATCTRHTQFAGNHPYCDEHGMEQEDYFVDDSCTFWTRKADRQETLRNIIAGAEQQEDDTEEYREIPMTTINGPNGKPYLSVIADGELIKLRLHKYDNMFDRGIYLTFDRKALTDVINALEKYEHW